MQKHDKNVQPRLSDSEVSIEMRELISVTGEVPIKGWVSSGWIGSGHGIRTPSFP